MSSIISLISDRDQSNFSAPSSNIQAFDKSNSYVLASSDGANSFKDPQNSVLSFDDSIKPQESMVSAITPKALDSQNNFGSENFSVHEKSERASLSSTDKPLVRIFHAIVSKHQEFNKNLNIYLDDKPFALNLNSGDCTGYLPCQNGNNILKLKLASNGLLIGSHSLELQSNHSYTIILWGKINKGGKILYGVSAHVDIQTCSVAGKARLQFMQGTPHAPMVDVIVNGSAIFSQVPFGHTNSLYETLPLGTHELMVRDSFTGIIIVGPLSLNLQSGNSCTLMIHGSKNNIRGLLIHNNIREGCFKDVILKSFRPLVGTWHHIASIGELNSEHKASKASTDCTWLSQHLQVVTSFYNSDNMLINKIKGHVKSDGDSQFKYSMVEPNNSDLNFNFVINYCSKNILIIGCPYRLATFILSKKTKISKKSLEKLKIMIADLGYSAENLNIFPETIRD